MLACGVHHLDLDSWRKQLRGSECNLKSKSRPWASGKGTPLGPLKKIFLGGSDSKSPKDCISFKGCILASATVSASTTVTRPAPAGMGLRAPGGIRTHRVRGRGRGKGKQAVPCRQRRLLSGPGAAPSAFIGLATPLPAKPRPRPVPVPPPGPPPGGSEGSQGRSQASRKTPSALP